MYTRMLTWRTSSQRLPGSLLLGRAVAKHRLVCTLRQVYPLLTKCTHCQASGTFLNQLYISLLHRQQQDRPLPRPRLLSKTAEDTASTQPALHRSQNSLLETITASGRLSLQSLRSPVSSLSGLASATQKFLEGRARAAPAASSGSRAAFDPCCSSAAVLAGGTPPSVPAGSSWWTPMHCCTAPTLASGDSGWRRRAERTRPSATDSCPLCCGCWRYRSPPPTLLWSWTITERHSGAVLTPGIYWQSPSYLEKSNRHHAVPNYIQLSLI